MPILSWDGLQKNATDDETIEEAIARLIGVHEVDSNSHLGVGESLQSHKSEEVIDHPALSILADKFSNDKMFITLDVTNFDIGNADTCSVSSDTLYLYTSQDSGDSGEGVYSFYSNLPWDFGYDDGDVIVDFIIQGLDLTSTAQGEFSFGFAKLQLKSGYYRIGYFTTSWQYGDWVAVSSAYYLRFRFTYDVASTTMYVFLKDTQVYSHVHSIAFEDDEFSLKTKLNRGGASSASISLGAVKWWLDGI